jgi:hypothetical protein
MLIHATEQASAWTIDTAPQVAQDIIAYQTAVSTIAAVVGVVSLVLLFAAVAGFTWASDKDKPAAYCVSLLFGLATFCGIGWGASELPTLIKCRTAPSLVVIDYLRGQ